MKQARFFDYANGIVRIKINAGETLRHTSGGATDEGYAWETKIYTFDGETLTFEWHMQARDCDGRLDRHGVSSCHFRRLAKGYEDQDGVKFPAWQNDESSQRDYSAEAMNY